MSRRTGRNRKLSHQCDFDYPTIHQELAAYSAELRFSAGDCIKRLRELVERSE